MKQLTVGTLKALLEKVPDDLLICIGDDEELNGIHGAYFAQSLAGEDGEAYADLLPSADAKVFLIS